MNKDRKHEKDSRRKRIKDMIHSLNDKSSTPEDRLNDIYHGAKQKFLDKGNDPETATKKTFGIIMDMLPDDCAAKIDEDDNLIIANVKENKNE